MSGLAPTAGAPTGGSSAPAGSGALLIAGLSSAIFYNGASYQTAVFYSAAGSGASLIGTGVVAHTFSDGGYWWMQWTEQFAARMIYHSNEIFEGSSFSAATTGNYAVSAHATFDLGGSGTYVWTPGATIIEGFKFSTGLALRTYAQVQMTDGLTLAHEQVLAMLAHLTQSMTISPQFASYLGTIALARIGMSDKPVASLKYHLPLSETLRIADIYQRFAGAFLTDGVRMGDVASRAYRAVSTITEFLTLSLTQHYAMAFRVTLKDNVDMSADALLHAVYHMNLTEIIDLDVLYQSPSGTMTAWAINTRTGATTEYQNWDFNSFAQMGTKYIASSATGLYELNGPTDDGLSVVADIMGGFLQPAGQHLGGLKGVYLGQTGQGYWLLKLETGDGREYVYQRLSNPGLMTTKFTIGKGINARYIGWELISVEGQDFDLDAIEFVPMLRTRRV